jgi:hypothetical protein
MAIIYPANDAKAPQNELSHVVPLVLDQKTRTTKYWATADWAGDPDFAPDIEAFETKVRTLASRWKFDDKPKK